MEQIKVFRTTLKDVIHTLESLQNIPLNDFQGCVIEAFEGYNYEGEEELKGFDSWCDISKNGEYQLTIGINHDDAYIFTLFIENKNGTITINNVL